MNPAQYRRREEVELEAGLSPGFQYDVNLIPSYQPNYQLLSTVQDGLPRLQLEQYQPLSSYSSSNFSSNSNSNSSFAAASMNLQGYSAWNNPMTATSFEDGNTSYGFGSSSSGNYDESFRNHQPYHQEIPRTCSMAYDSNVAHDTSIMTSRPYTESTSYVLDPIRDEMQNPGLAYETFDNTRDFARLSLSHSPQLELDQDIASPSRSHYPPHDTNNTPAGGMLPSDGSEDGGHYSREMTAVDVDELSTDEPYAKLIYRALLSKPEHSMVLQEIYQWFRDNTNKGQADGKGWMNSIRHNLSMNAAFKKTERKVPGDETKKSTEWVLEPFAVTDGVQSTTRYRKGTGAKKFVKSDTPAPARQASGRKGGMSTNLLKRQRGRDDSRDREHRPPPPPMLDTRSRSHYHDGMGHSSHSSHHRVQRQISPLTPDMGEAMHVPYYVKTESSFERGGLEDVPGYGSVQGVYTGGNSPLFESPVCNPFNASLFANGC